MQQTNSVWNPEIPTMHEAASVNPSPIGNGRIQRLGATLEGILANAERLLPHRGDSCPADDTWSASQILAHLVEMLPYWAEQARMVSARQHDGEPFGRTHADPQRIAAVERGAHGDARALIPLVRAALERANDSIRAIADADWQRTARHANRGEMSVEQIVDHFLLDHAEEHAQQLAAVARG
jgi:hypothetical protein